MLRFIFFAVILASALGFRFNVANAANARKVGSRQVRSDLKMNFFANLFGPKQTATARHILMDQKDITQLEGLKQKIMSSSDITVAFGQAASQYSKCPSSQKAGSLGEFGKGAMVPAFDKVVFDPNSELGVVQGPVSTPFGVHLILIEDRNSS